MLVDLHWNAITQRTMLAHVTVCYSKHCWQQLLQIITRVSFVFRLREQFYVCCSLNAVGSDQQTLFIFRSVSDSPNLKAGNNINRHQLLE